MRNKILEIVSKYLDIYPLEVRRVDRLVKYLDVCTDEALCDWNNFDGHLVAGGFIYSKKENKFLVMYHNDLKMYLYPGGHVDKEDSNPLVAAKREVIEETGIVNFDIVSVSSDKVVPIDIDTQKIPYNERLDLPSHYHFDFRYLFVIDEITDVIVDTSELSDYKWISIDELSSDTHYGYLMDKFKEYI